jgi:protoporphyrinogen oxidase
VNLSDAGTHVSDEHVIVLGAGPSGLAASLALCRGGIQPLVLERDDDVGGLMRSYRWREFIVDLGRKELYTRFPEVDALWNEALGGAYGPYPHRVGSLYRGRILELSGKYRGILRGIPIPWLVHGGLSMLGGWARAAARSPTSYEAYWHGRVGRVFAELLAQGYWEKFRGRRWQEMPVPEDETTPKRSRSFETARQALRLARRGGVQTQAAWRHPTHGTGQIFEALRSEIDARGGRIRFNAEVRAIRPQSDGSFEIEFLESGVVHRRASRHLISSLPIERLTELLGAVPNDVDGREARRSVILVYLFLDEPPQFPHAWLEVNDPMTAIGRITSYAAFGGAMVPPGHTSLCIEFFCQADDPFMQMDDEALTERTLKELAGAGLVHPGRLIGSSVRRLQRTNAAASWREQQTERRLSLLRSLARYPTLYHVNRPGSDWATLAGLLAAEAVLTKDRAVFDQRADPTVRHVEVPIRPQVAAEITK